jgi:hypothetical protein
VCYSAEIMNGKIKIGFIVAIVMVSTGGFRPRA